jgi:hypothetical protein
MDDDIRTILRQMGATMTALADDNVDVTHQAITDWSQKLAQVASVVRNASYKAYWDKKGRYEGRNAPLSANNPPSS